MQERRKSKPDPYRGPLIPKSAAAGIMASKLNAKRLFEDAERLFQASRFPSACALAALTVEEASKSAIIRKILLAQTTEEVSRGWKMFASHHDKATPWILPHIVGESAAFEDFVERFMRNSDPVLLDSLKQISIYCGCYGKCHWSAPTDVIEKDQAGMVLRTAKISTCGGELSDLDSEQGLSLWSNHMRGCFSVGYVTANDRVVQFLHKAHEIGLLSESRIPPTVAFDFMATVVALSDGEAEEQRILYGLDP